MRRVRRTRRATPPAAGDRAVAADRRPSRLRSRAAPTPKRRAPPSAQAAERRRPPLSAAEQPTQVAGLTPAQYADLFDRMRAGFKLDDDAERAAIDQQLRLVRLESRLPASAPSAAPSCTCTTSSPSSKRAACRSRSRCCRWSKAPSSRTPTRARAPRACGSSFPDTGSRYGLKQDWWYDGRRDVVESTRAALDYLQSLHDEFNGDWLLAIAAYNCGEMAVERAVDANRAAGKPIDFWNLKLPAETRAYVPKLLAMRRLVADPETYGLAFSPIPNQPYFARVDDRRPDRPEGRRRDRRRDRRGAVRAQSGLPSLGDRSRRARTTCCCRSMRAQVFTQNVVAAHRRAAHARRRTTRCGRGDSVASVAKRFNTTRQRRARAERSAQRAADRRHRPARALGTRSACPRRCCCAAARVDGRGRSRAPRARACRAPRRHAVDHRAPHGMDVNTLAMMNGMQPGDPLRAGQRLQAVRTATRRRAERRSARVQVTYTVRAGDTLAQIAQAVPVLACRRSWPGTASAPRHAFTPGRSCAIRMASRRG